MAYTRICQKAYSGNSNCILYVEYQVNSTSTTAHNVTFRCAVQVKATTQSWNADTDTTVTFKVGSTTVKSGTWTFDFRSVGTYTIASTTISCTSGRTVAVEATHNSGVSLGSATCSGSVTLPTIVNETYSKVTKLPSSVYNGSSWVDQNFVYSDRPFKYTFSSPSSGLTTKLVLTDTNSASVGNIFSATVSSGEEITLGTTGTMENFWKAYPNRMSIAVSFRHCTYSGSTQKYIDYKTLIINLRESAHGPSAPGVTVTDTNSKTTAKTGDSSKCIVGYSTLSVKITASTPKLGASISKYVIKCGSYTQEVTGTGTYTISNAPSNVVSVYAVDSRNFKSSTTTVTKTVYPYTPVSLSNFTATRSNSGMGTSVILKWSVRGTVYSYNYYYKRRASNVTDYSKGSLTIATTATTITSNGYGTGNAYDFKLTATDGIVTSTVYAMVGIARPAFKVTTDSNMVLRNDFYLESSSGTRKSLLDVFYPVGTIYQSTQNVNPSSFLGGTWTAIEGRFLIGANSTYTSGSTGGGEMRNSRDEATGYGLTISNSFKNRVVVTTESGTTLPPYKAVYIWERTA